MSVRHGLQNLSTVWELPIRKTLIFDRISILNINIVSDTMLMKFGHEL